jgi:hypothetical protein
MAYSRSGPQSSDTGKTNGLIEVKKEEATTVAAANDSRVSLTLTNDSENVIYVWKGEGAEVSKGIRLAAGQGVSFDNYTGIVTAAAKTAKSNLCVSEV